LSLSFSPISEALSLPFFEPKNTTPDCHGASFKVSSYLPSGFFFSLEENFFPPLFPFRCFVFYTPSFPTPPFSPSSTSPCLGGGEMRLVQKFSTIFRFSFWTPHWCQLPPPRGLAFPSAIAFTFFFSPNCFAQGVIFTVPFLMTRFDTPIFF